MERVLTPEEKLAFQEHLSVGLQHMLHTHIFFVAPYEDASVQHDGLLLSK